MPCVVGDKVRVLPPRGEVKQGDQRLWRVEQIERVDGTRVAHLLELDAEEPENQVVIVDDLVVVAEFNDRIYPGLVETGRVERGGDKPFHTVINAENFHALEMLTYTHRGKVDAIYIDPPYNTGAKDWKYNNNYVEGDDDYRHSKWLAFMERRLEVARELLNPEDSVLIVTIDEKEYARLALLLEQTFPEARIQMVSSVINPKGSHRSGGFARSDEYLFFVMIGQAAPLALPLGAEWKIVNDRRAQTLRWAELLRTGDGSSRVDRPNMFYPVFVQAGDSGPMIHSVGEPYSGTDLDEVAAPKGCSAVWPIKANGGEGRWQTSPENLRQLVADGFARLGAWRGGRTAISYLKAGEQAKVKSGQFPITGRRSDNSVIVDSASYSPSFVPSSQWRLSAHNAEQRWDELDQSTSSRAEVPVPQVPVCS